MTPLEPDSTLIAVIEMSLSSWLVAGIVPGVERQDEDGKRPHWAGLLRAVEASPVARLPVSLLGPVLRACGLEALAV